MASDAHINAHDDLNRAFDTGSVFTATPQELESYLRALGSLNINSDAVRSKSVVRALTINHLQMARTIGELETTIKKLNAENSILSKRVLVLTVVAVIFGAIQAFGVFWMIFRSA